MLENDYVSRIESNLLSSRALRSQRTMDTYTLPLLVLGVLFFGGCIWITAAPPPRSDDKAIALADAHLFHTSTFLH